jgi:hypothetical protein
LPHFAGALVFAFFNFFETNAVTARSIFVCSAILLLANVAYGARYQRTQDGKTLVWNNLRGVAHGATWSGGRESDGYATGEGTLTWYRGELKIATDSSKPLKEGSVVVSSYTGKMVRGKFEGLVAREQGGTTLYTTFVNGNKASYWSSQPTTAAKTKEQQLAKPVRKEPVESAVAEEPKPSPVATATPKKERPAVATSTPKPAPSPTPSLPPVEQPWTEPVLTAPATAVVHERSTSPADHKREEVVRKDAVAETPAPTRDRHTLELAKPPSSLRMTLGTAPSPQASLRSTPASPPPASPPPVEAAAKEGTVADLKEQTQSVLSRVGDATNNFHEVDGLDSVEKLPAPVAESVVSLVDRARERRLELGYETALHEYGTEIQTADALSVVDQITRNIGYNNAAEASSKVADFLKNNPEPVADSQKPLWRYLTSVQTLCSRLEKEADVHLQRAQSLAATGKSSEAIQEYREANRIFPSPAAAQKIRQLSSSPSAPLHP